MCNNSSYLAKRRPSSENDIQLSSKKLSKSFPTVHILVLKIPVRSVNKKVFIVHEGQKSLSFLLHVLAKIWTLQRRNSPIFIVPTATTNFFFSKFRRYKNRPKIFFFSHHVYIRSLYGFCSLKLECEKLASEKIEVQRHYVMVSVFEKEKIWKNGA